MSDNSKAMRALGKALTRLAPVDDLGAHALISTVGAALVEAADDLDRQAKAMPETPPNWRPLAGEPRAVGK